MQFYSVKIRSNALCVFTGDFVEVDFIKGFDEFMGYFHEPLQYIYGEYALLESVNQFKIFKTEILVSNW